MNRIMALSDFPIEIPKNNKKMHLVAPW